MKNKKKMLLVSRQLQIQLCKTWFHTFVKPMINKLHYHITFMICDYLKMYYLRVKLQFSHSIRIDSYSPSSHSLHYQSSYLISYWDTHNVFIWRSFSLSEFSFFFFVNTIEQEYRHISVLTVLCPPLFSSSIYLISNL